MNPVPGSRRVVRSIESSEGTQCVDLFERGDGSFGFEEFRRDVEDGGRWHLTGGYSALRYPCLAEAGRAARPTVGWLSDTPASW